MTEAFVAPRHASLFVDNTRERCLALIATGIWSGITRTDFLAWTNNFQGPDEQYFAACLLDALIYRSTRQTNALCYQLLQRALPDLCRENHILHHADQEHWSGIRDLTSHPEIRLVSVVRDSDSPATSGPLVTRLFRETIRIDDELLIWPRELIPAIERGASCLVFLDDFLGTGAQFFEFAIQYDLQALSDAATLIYAPLVAHADGIEYLRGLLPTLYVCAAEHLDADHHIFSENSSPFEDGTNTVQTAREFYQALLSRRRIAIPEAVTEGFGGLGLTYAFEHAVPDNSIPIFRTHSSWHPLFP